MKKGEGETQRLQGSPPPQSRFEPSTSNGKKREGYGLSEYARVPNGGPKHNRKGKGGRGVPQKKKNKSPTHTSLS